MNRIKKIVSISLGSIAIFMTLSFLIYGILFRPKTIEEYDFDKIYTKKKLQNDADQLFYTLLTTHPAITKERDLKLGDHTFNLLSEREFEEEEKIFLNQINQDMTGREYIKKLLPVLSKIGDEHTEIEFFNPNIFTEINQVKKFPYDLTFDKNNIYLSRNTIINGHFYPKNSKIQKINSVESDELLSHLICYFSGFNNAQRQNYVKHYYREAMYLEFGEKENQTITIDGVTQFISLKSKKVDSIEPYSYSIKGNEINLKLSEFVDDKNFRLFLKKMFAEAKKRNVTNLVIDVRNSRGGATQAGDDLLFYLTDKEFSQLNYSDIKVSEKSKDYFLSYIPSFLRLSFLQYYIPPLNQIFTSKTGDFVRISFDSKSKKINNPFKGNVIVKANAGTMSSASLLCSTIEKYKLGTVNGKPGGKSNHFGNQLEYCTDVGIKMWIPTSFNSGN